jgi:pimeloyl-ACP methyl ester carboxylesterase
MLAVERTGTTGPLVVMLHWLGGSSCSWQAVSEGLKRRGYQCAAVDLPGFGQESGESAVPVLETTQRIVEKISALRAGNYDDLWLLAGHSMGGKLAMIVASMAERKVAGLENLSGLLLISPSPPSPEPMSEKKRDELIRGLGPEETNLENRRQHAETFVNDNVGRLPLTPEVMDSAVADVLRINPEAWSAWLTEGSKEDWAEQVRKLATPALILAGSEDKDLGLNSQQEHTSPHFRQPALVCLEGGGHLAPLERPAEVVDRFAEFCEQIGLSGKPEHTTLGPAMDDLIASDQTSPQTRMVLLNRLPDPDGEAVFFPEELRTLRALALRIVPDAKFDLTSRVKQELAKPLHDGWRFDSLPSDLQAWKRGLESLDLAALREFHVPFVALDGPRQDELLFRAREGKLGKGLLGAMHLSDSEDALDSDQMRDWFEDVRGELVKIYVSDPRTMERIGFTGFADEKGFTQIELGDSEVDA